VAAPIVWRGEIADLANELVNVLASLLEGCLVGINSNLIEESRVEHRALVSPAESTKDCN